MPDIYDATCEIDSYSSFAPCCVNSSALQWRSIPTRSRSCSSFVHYQTRIGNLDTKFQRSLHILSLVIFANRHYCRLVQSQHLKRQRRHRKATIQSIAQPHPHAMDPFVVLQRDQCQELPSRRQVPWTCELAVAPTIPIVTWFEHEPTSTRTLSDTYSFITKGCIQHDTACRSHG